MIAYYHGILIWCFDLQKKTMRVVTCNHFKAHTDPIFKTDVEATRFVQAKLYYNMVATIYMRLLEYCFHVDPIVILHIAYEIIIIKFQKFTMNMQKII